VDLQIVINLGLGVIMALLGWFAHEVWSAVKELKSDMSGLREDLPKVYVMKEDYRRDIYEIKDMLSRIFDKLDGKADK
jgi:hypothetical protein